MTHIDTPAIIDTHVHFDDPRFDDDRDAVYQRAISSGVSAMVIPAVTRDQWGKIQSLSKKYSGVFATAGLHPVFCNQHQHSDLDLLEHTLQTQQVVAIGECGLDGSIAEPDPDAQPFYFAAQLDLAKRYQLPVIIHARSAIEKVIITLKKHNLSNAQGNGVIHSYNGSLQQAHRLIDLGYKVSFGGPVTYPRSRKLQSLVKQLPMDAMMLETDAPDQPPHQPPDKADTSTNTHKKQRNEPGNITSVLQAVATLRGQSASEIAETSNQNARQLFNLPDTALNPQPPY